MYQYATILKGNMLLSILSFTVRGIQKSTFVKAVYFNFETFPCSTRLKPDREAGNLIIEACHCKDP